MRWLLQGYYGYKNFWDEVLLLGIIPYLFTQYPLEKLYIEAQDPERLHIWLGRHEEIVWHRKDRREIIPKHTAWKYRREDLFLWGGEVLTDGRGFPHNGRNYLLRHPIAWITGKYHLLWGVWTPTNRASRLLRELLVGHAKSVVVREKRSYEITTYYRKEKSTTLYHDFAEDVLTEIADNLKDIQKKEPKTALLNVNPYIRSPETKDRLVAYTNSFTSSLFFPAEIGVDNTFFDALIAEIPHLTLYDRTQYSLETICRTVASCSGVMWARLHVLWLAYLLHIPFEALVYQEKISTFLEQCSGDLS